MLPPNDVLESFWQLLVQFFSSRYIAILILVGLFLWAQWMVKQFNNRVLKYTDKTPPERHWLMLQCIRWERYSSQMRAGATLTLLLGFVIFVFAQMIDDLIGQLGLQSHSRTQFADLFLHFQIAFYFFFMTLKLRALWDATGVYRDLKKLQL